MIYYDYFESYKLLVVRWEGDTTVNDFIGVIDSMATEFNDCKPDYILSDFRKAKFIFDPKGIDEILRFRAEKAHFKPKYISVFLVDDVIQTTYTTLYNSFLNSKNLKFEIKVCVTISKAASLLGLMANPGELERMLQNLKQTYTLHEQVRL